jgi:predicted DNA-binding antitoxin AbrB/MazE fold protein
MKTEEIKEIQRKVGTDDDGIFLRDSISKTKAYLRSLMPKESPWPGTSQAELTQFYGKPGDESQLVNLPVEDLDVFYEGKKVKTIRCHKKVSASLRRILEKIQKSKHNIILRKYDGCYNNRSMRGGSTPSLHARGAAIDFDAANNGNHTSWPNAATMPFEVMEIFAKEGWIAAGAFWGRDAMHFQATK